VSSESELEYAVGLLRQSYEFALEKIGKRATAKVKRAEERPITHSEIVSMLCDVGNILGFFVRVEETTPDGAYRCDVTWRDSEAHAPLKVFEVETSHRIDHALSSLAHAHDVWRPERLYLIVSDERDLNRAIKLAEPYVKGAFYRILRKLKIHAYKEIKDLYDDVINHKDMIADLSMR